MAEDVKKQEGEVTVFFANYSTYEGERARLYRSPERIREDILEIKKRIASIDSMLNIRNILTEMIDKYSEGDPITWITILEQIVSDTEDSLMRLKSLKESLDILSEELEDTVWALGT